MVRLRWAWSLAVLGGAAAAPAAEQEVTVGGLGLLLARPAQAATPEIVDKVTAGLRHPRPELRATAARVAASLPVPSLAPALAAALRAETVTWAASEEAHALALHGGAEAEAAILEAGARLGRDVLEGGAESLARVRGTAALSIVPALRARGVEQLRRVVLAATRGRGDALTRAGSAALRDADAVTWEAVLEVAREFDAELSDGLFVAGVGSRAAALRAATYWHLAEQRAPAPSEALRKALAEVPEATATEPSAEVFALEVLRRALGAKAVPNRAWLARVESAAPLDLPSFAQRPRLNRLLTKEERGALSRRLMGETSALEDELRGWERDSRLPAAAERPGEVRMISDLPVGFVGGILAASGCQPRKDEIAAAEVKFHADGRVQHVTLRTAPEGAGCREAVAALFVALAAPNERLPHTGTTDLVFARFDRDTLACLDEAPPESPQESPPRGTRRKITPPRKVRNVSPVYPEAARQSRTEGVVALEATIGTTGCIHSLRVLSGPPALALAAMDAVSQWRYSPALLDGRPVPVIMTVTVNFRGR